MKVKKLLLLWAPLADYSVAGLKELSQKSNLDIYIIYQAGDKDAPYNNFDLSFSKGAYIYNQSEESKLFDFSIKLNPDAIIMSSWNYSFYMSISKQCKKKGTYVISTFDGQWEGTVRQRIGIMLSSLYLKPCIDNFLVPGDRQAIFARKLGYKNPLQGYYCANTDRFNQVSVQPKDQFIFIGRLIRKKGVEILIKAYKKYRSLVASPWDLVICGVGDLQHICENQDGVHLRGFLQPAELPAVLRSAKCLILPSFHEPWGLVVHEATLSGLTIIASSAVGASISFIRDGQNGYIINADLQSLLRAMILISKADSKKQIEMSLVSKQLGMLWTTNKWANYIHENIVDYQFPKKSN